jgi:hypothetical protein
MHAADGGPITNDQWWPEELLPGLQSEVISSAARATVHLDKRIRHVYIPYTYTHTLSSRVARAPETETGAGARLYIGYVALPT